MKCEEFMKSPPKVKVETPIKFNCDKCGKEFYYAEFERIYCRPPTRSDDFSEYFMTPEQLMERYKEMHKVICPYCYNVVIKEICNAENKG